MNPSCLADFQRALCAALLALCALVPTSAQAGRRPFIWTYDTEVLPSRGVELEQWVWERRMRDPGGAGDLTSVWWAPVIGLTDQLELALPVEWFWVRGTPIQLETAGLDVRYRFFSANPEEAGPVVPLLRAGVKRLFMHQDAAQVELNAVVGFDVSPSVHAAIDLGGTWRTDGSMLIGTYAGGVSYLLTDELRIGTEFLGELFSAPEHPGIFFLAPNLSYTLGRFWATFGILFGINESAPRMMPRLIWAVSF